MPRWIACGLGLVAAWSAVAPARANPVPAGAQYSTATIRSADGTPLHADVLLPASRRAGERVAPIVVVSPYLGQQGSGATAPSIPAKYADLIAGAFSRGYAVVLVTLRGYGASGGCRDFGGPGEQADAVAAVEWAAAQPWSTGRVAMWGLSTDGWAALMAVARRARRLRAVIAMAPVVSAYRVDYERGVRYTPFAELVQPYYAVYALPPLTLNDLAQVRSGLERLLAAPACGVGDLAEQLRADPSTPYWRARDLEPALRGARVPLFWTHGLLDANVRPDQMLATWDAWRGPRRAWLGQFPHVVPGQSRALIGRGGFADEAFGFLDRYVLGVRGAPREPAVAVQEGRAGSWRAERSWPPADARPRSMRVLGGAVLAAPGNKGELYCVPSLAAPATAWDPACVPGPAGIGAWSLTPPLADPVWLAGVARLRVRVAAAPRGAHLVALLYDVDRAGAATLVSRAAIALGGSGPISLRLAPQDWRFAPGHRIGLLLSGADDLWFAPPPTVGVISVAGDGTLELPVLGRERTRFLPDTAPSASVRQRTAFPLLSTLLGARQVPDLSP